jgi:hypothetical protein
MSTGFHAPRSDPGGAEARFAAVADDALSAAQRALGLMPRAGSGIGRRIAIAVAITWLPLVIYALWQRRLVPGEVPEPLLQHFGIHARLLLALPLLILAEATTRSSLERALPQFLGRGLVGDAEVPAFRAVLERASRARGSRAVLAGMLALVLLVAVLGWGRSDELHELVWARTADAGGIDFGIAWFSFVSRPLFLLALLAWLWRLAVVGWAFGRIARLDLRLTPTHPDRVGGLGFLERLPMGFFPLLLALSVPIAGRWGHDALYHGLDVNTLRAPVAALVLLNVVIAVAPMLAFAPRLRALRRRALSEWGALLAEHGRLVERRWVRREKVADDALLSAPEIGPVADTVALYETVRGLRAAPIARSSLIAPVLATAIPLVPVFATQVPLKEIVAKLLGGLVGI